jgi:hypothetical protein
MVETWKGTGELMPGDGSQNGIMSPTGIRDVYFTLADFNGSLSLDKMTVESRGIALFKAAQMSS